MCYTNGTFGKRPNKKCKEEKIMRKKITCLLLVLLSLSLLTVVGCGDEEIVISGVPAEIAIKATETDYDFLSGVSATKDGKAASVSVDKSEVKFGTPGEYTVKFTVGEETATAKVKIYGMPTYTAQDAEIGYGEDLTKGIVCKDSFGKDLELTHSEPEKDGEGRVLYKTHEITYTAQDAVGNVAEFKRKVTVVDNALTAVRDKTVDLADASVSWIVGDDSSVVSVKKIAGDKKEDVAASNYTFASQVGRFAFKPEYLATLATETAHEFDLTFSTGHKSVKITVTDSQDPKYTVDGDVDGLELCEGAVKLPETVKNAESHQKIDVEYLLNDQPITDLNPELEAGDYEFAIVYKRGGAEIGAARVEMNFTVLTAKDFYGREISSEKFLTMWKVMVA